jgi:MFS family permease
MVAILEIGAFSKCLYQLAAIDHSDHSISLLVTSLLAAPLADAKGRRFTVRLGAAVFSIGGAVQTFTRGYRSMCIGRIISGFGVGMLRYVHPLSNTLPCISSRCVADSMIVPIYQSEISPAEHRGRLACIEFTGNIIGYASSIWIDYFCSFITSDLSWRIPLFIQCLGGVILAAGTFVIPESPR